MNPVLLYFCGASLMLLGSLGNIAHGQSMMGMSSPLNQTQAIESQLHQARTLARKESEEAAKFQARGNESSKPAVTSQTPRQKPGQGETLRTQAARNAKVEQVIREK